MDERVSGSDDYMALQEQLEDLRDARIADAAYERYLSDPSAAISWEDAKDILRADGLIDEQSASTMMS